MQLLCKISTMKYQYFSQPLLKFSVHRTHARIRWTSYHSPHLNLARGPGSSAPALTDLPTLAVDAAELHAARGVR